MYNGYHHIYTDVSKEDEVASYGLWCDAKPEGTSARIRDGSSIFTAELEGIKFALRYIRISFRKKFVIFCDSKSVLESIDNHLTDNPLVVEVLDEIQELISRFDKIIQFCWVPSHVGITGNVKADKAANEGRAKEENTSLLIPSSDLIPLVRNFIRDKWQQRWEYKDSIRLIKLKEIMPIIAPFHTLGLLRREEVVIHRIRIGHTRLTHGYLMENKPIPNCPFCDNIPISIKHILIECVDLNNIRSRYHDATDLEELFDSFSLSIILDFLKEINIFDQI